MEMDTELLKFMSIKMEDIPLMCDMPSIKSVDEIRDMLDGKHSFHIISDYSTLAEINNSGNYNAREPGRAKQWIRALSHKDSLHRNRK